MLDKLVIHLKNIIFFKLVIYLVAITLLAVMVPRFEEELAKASIRREKAKSFLSQASLQLDSVAEFEEKIHETNLQYKNLLSAQPETTCKERQKLVANLRALSDKYQLSQPIKAEISTLFETGNKSKSGEIKMRQYDLLINFNVDTYKEALDLTNEICFMLPKGAIVMNMDINKIKALTPAVIALLSPEESPGLIDVNIKIRLREIVYEK